MYAHHTKGSSLIRIWANSNAREDSLPRMPANMLMRPVVAYEPPDCTGAYSWS